MIVLYMIKYRREGDIIRQKRIWYPGATYHAMARGIRRMVIFQDDTDYQVFLLLLKKMMILAAKKNTWNGITAVRVSTGNRAVQLYISAANTWHDSCLRGMLSVRFLNSHKKTCLKERRRQKIMKPQKKCFLLDRGC